MTILHSECVLGCDGLPFDFSTQRVGSCDSEILLLDEGNVLATRVANINFVGPRVQASGTGLAKTVTVWGGEAATAAAPATGPTGTPAFGAPLYQVSSIGELWHFIPGVGWRPIADYAQLETTNFGIAVPANAFTTVAQIVAPRAGKAIITAAVGVDVSGTPSTVTQLTSAIRINGFTFSQDNSTTVGNGSATNNGSLALSVVVQAGDIFEAAAFSSDRIADARGNIQLQYVS